MKIRLLISILVSFFICIVQPLLSAPLEIRSIYSDPVNNDVSVVIKVPEEIIQGDVTDFNLIEDDALTVTSTKIEPLQDSRWKIFMVMCIDTSGSMAKGPLMETKKALKAVLERNLFKSKDKLALIAFENEPRIIHFFDQYNEIIKKIDALEWLKGGGTALYQTLYDSIDHLEKFQPGAPALRHIIVISDGKDEGDTETTLKDVREKAIDLGIAIHVVARVRKDNSEEDLRQGFVQNLNALAGQTGGEFKHAEPGGVYDAMTQILKKIVSVSVVNFKREINTDGPTTKKVGVQLRFKDGSFFKVNIPMKIPSTKQKSSNLWILPILLSGILLIIIILLKFRRNHKKIKKPEIQMQHEKQSPVRVPEPEKRPYRKTQVGSYYSPDSDAKNYNVMMVGVDGPIKGQKFSVDKESFYIGADSECDLVILEDDYVSSSHAFLKYENNGFKIFDLGSQNGTFVNEELILDSGTVLSIGDKVRFGMSTFDIVEVS